MPVTIFRITIFTPKRINRDWMGICSSVFVVRIDYEGPALVEIMSDAELI